MSLDIKLTSGECPHCKHIEILWEGNITHNLTKMASVAGIYELLWRPNEGVKAKDLSPFLANSLQSTLRNEDLKELNPENGWGSYDYLVNFVKEYLAACQEYPEAIIEVSR